MAGQNVEAAVAVEVREQYADGALADLMGSLAPERTGGLGGPTARQHGRRYGGRKAWLDLPITSFD